MPLKCLMLYYKTGSCLLCRGGAVAEGRGVLMETTALITAVTNWPAIRQVRGLGQEAELQVPRNQKWVGWKDSSRWSPHMPELEKGNLNWLLSNKTEQQPGLLHARSACLSPSQQIHKDPFHPQIWHSAWLQSSDFQKDYCLFLFSLATCSLK